LFRNAVFTTATALRQRCDCDQKTNAFICLSAKSQEVAASRSAGIGTYVVVVVDQHGRRKVVAAASQSQL